MPLGIDATLRYALNHWTRPLRVSELNSDSPTTRASAAACRRRRSATPASPRCAPPRTRRTSPYLFYVVKPCGNGAHAFSSTDAQFQQDVAEYNRARAKLGGKDPSHC